jgi:Domain of unknown function (DUF1772)
MQRGSSMLFGGLALVAGSVFHRRRILRQLRRTFGRSRLDSLLAEWKPAYKRRYHMQASLAVVGFVLGLFAWWTTGTVAFAIGALLIITNWPWTLLAIRPTIRTLMATDESEANADTRALMMKWNRLHAVRTVLGGLAVTTFMIVLSGS